MSQEAITEIDMDVFSRRIGPYFSWLESRIESGWEQSDIVEKDMLKEVRYLATTMRARFILGVSKEDFSKEVERALELFELSRDAFPAELDEIDIKEKHFSKGITEELGPQFLPDSPRPPEPPEPHPVPEPQPVPEPEPIPDPEPPEPEPQEKVEVVETKVQKVVKPKVQKVEKPKVRQVKAPKPKVQKLVKKSPKVQKSIEKVKSKVIEKPKVQKSTVKKPKSIEAKPEVKKSAKKSKKKFFLKRWIQNFIYGDNI